MSKMSTMNFFVFLWYRMLKKTHPKIETCLKWVLKFNVEFIFLNCEKLIKNHRNWIQNASFIHLHHTGAMPSGSTSARLHSSASS